MINIKEKLFNWVENKIGDKVDERIEESYNSKEKLNVEKFANELVNEVFNDIEIKKLREKIMAEKGFESDFSNADTDDDFIDLDLLDLSQLKLDPNASSGNDAENACRQILEAFEYQSLDEVIGQPNWPGCRKALQDMLLSSDNKNLTIFSLKIFKRFLASDPFPRAVCEGFSTLCESVLSQIEGINKRVNTVESEDLYDIRDNKVYHRSSQRNRIEPSTVTSSLDTLTRSMLLLLSAHDNMPAVWLRFNEKRLHEIIFSFVDMLASSISTEKRNATGLDVAVILQPRATWCRHWSHSALGRTLLCQALRKQRRLFHYIVDIVITYIVELQEVKSRKQSAPQKITNLDKNQVISVLGVAEPSLKNARFCHCFSILTYLVQHRAGRTLFPLQSSVRKRPWSVQDILGLMIDYIEVVHTRLSFMYTPYYVHHLAGLAGILLAVKQEISSARGTQPIRRYK